MKKKPPPILAVFSWLRRILKGAILVTVIAFLIFGVFYALIYKATARAYYSIVLSGGNE